MSKSKRLMELMIAVNKRKKFTVRELAEEFQVSMRTIMRDLQVLSELGIPLYTEYGPHGGYRVLRERLLPPITFSEQEAVAMFFAYQSLQHYGALPFAEESTTALNKFYYYLPDDTKEVIDKMKQRVVFWTPKRYASNPYLKPLLDASLQQHKLAIVYDSKEGAKSRIIQPIGVYSHNGYWYCPAYCHLKERFLLFRVDRVLAAELSNEDVPGVDLSRYSIMDWFKPKPSGHMAHASDALFKTVVKLTRDGVRRCQWEAYFGAALHVEPDGTGTLRLDISASELDYYTSYFLGFGADAVIVQPAEMVAMARSAVNRLAEAYREP
ncbi:helix-turn-helix transcriptional regulator [Paenibacillus rigui]|uniref:Transcriptional regulator n=1 Tax=Paenibacillus rigui TaxID=554312 RepID=A0A229UWX5_9BACL|nr:YafY family protein [Paenibacillus rigui]OXM87843.1 transcriptional regulator [Paenibacillus rigui]